MSSQVPATVPPAVPAEARYPVIAGERGLVIRSMDDLFRVARAVASSGLAPSGMTRPEQVFVAIQTGMEAGLTPMASLQALVVISGQVRWRGDAALALVRRSGLLEGYDVKYVGTAYEDAFECVVTVKRRGFAGAVEGRFSVRDAKDARLWAKATRSGEPTPWMTAPRRMLYYRALGYALRDAFSDVLLSLNTAEEYNPGEDYAPQATVAAAPAAQDALLASVADEAPAPAEIARPAATSEAVSDAPQAPAPLEVDAEPPAAEVEDAPEVSPAPPPPAAASAPELDEEPPPPDEPPPGWELAKGKERPARRGMAPPARAAAPAPEPKPAQQAGEGPRAAAAPKRKGGPQPDQKALLDF